MKAAVFKDTNQPLQIETLPDPVADPGNLVVRVAYCGICGTDLHATRPGPAQVPCNSVLGHEFVGTVVEVGAGCDSHWRHGDRVCALPFLACGICQFCVNGKPFQCPQRRLTGLEVPGGFAEYVKTSAAHTLHLPDELSLKTAALVEPLAVGLHAARTAGLQPNQTVLVLGAGPIGLAVMLWARALGARAVLISEPDLSRQALAQTLGASALLDPQANLAEQVLDYGGQAADIIFDCVGQPGVLQQCIDSAAFGCTIVPVGVCEQPDTFVPFAALVKELRIQYAIAYDRSDFATTLAALASGRLNANPMITRQVSLDEMPPVFDSLRKPGGESKVLVEIAAA